MNEPFDSMNAVLDAPHERFPVPVGSLSVAKGQDICLMDLQHNTAAMDTLIAFGALLKKLEGRSVLSVHWINKPDRVDNPDGTIGHYEVVYY